MCAVSAPAEAPARVDQTEAQPKAKAKRADTVPFLAEGAPKLTSPETPEGYNTSKHKPLSKSDFSEEYIYLQYKAGEYERKAAKLRSEAETIQKLGNASDRKQAKKLMQMQQKMAELARELSADGGIDLASILGADQLAALLGTKPAE